MEVVLKDLLVTLLTSTELKIYYGINRKKLPKNKEIYILFSSGDLCKPNNILINKILFTIEN